MKILSIGNSFSQDAHKWLKPVCDSAGVDVLAVNLYIGGCSLETHWYNWTTETPAYELEVNGEYQQKISLQEALAMDEWDVITLQQASPFSGQPQTYVPFIADLAAAVRERCPGATLYIQETWAYERDSDHPAFATYHGSQTEMYARLKDAYCMASRLIDAPIIPVGTVIQQLRDQSPEFDYPNGGRSLNRDGFHLSWTYGRYAAALTWYAVLLNGDVDRVSFGDEIAEKSLLAVIKNAVKTVLNK